MADTFQLEVATPERLFVDEQVTEAQLPGENGYFGVLAGHAPLVSALKPGLLSYNSGGGTNVIVLDGGFAEVFDNHVRVLADSAERSQDIQTDPARRQLEEANKALGEAQDEESSKAALREQQRAQARLDASEKSDGSRP